VAARGARAAGRTALSAASPRMTGPGGKVSRPPGRLLLVARRCALARATRQGRGIAARFLSMKGCRAHRLRWRIYAAVVRRPATLATRQGPLLLLACCHYRDGVSGPIIGFSQKLRAARIHNVAPTCQGLPSKSTRVARPRLSLNRLAGAASAHSRLGHSLL